MVWVWPVAQLSSVALRHTTTLWGSPCIQNMYIYILLLVYHVFGARSGSPQIILWCTYVYPVVTDLTMTLREISCGSIIIWHVQDTCSTQIIIVMKLRKLCNLQFHTAAVAAVMLFQIDLCFCVAPGDLPEHCNSLALLEYYQRPLLDSCCYSALLPTNQGDTSVWSTINHTVSGLATGMCDCTRNLTLIVKTLLLVPPLSFHLQIDFCPCVVMYLHKSHPILRSLDCC